MLKGASGFRFSGGGVGLKTPGIVASSVVPASVTNTTSNTLVASDTIPAGTLKVGSWVEVFGQVIKSGTGTASLRVLLSDGTNSIQMVGYTGSAGAVLMQAGNGIACASHASQNSVSFASPYSTGTPASSILDETKAWTVNYYLQQSVATDTSTLTYRRVQVYNP